MWSKRQDRDRRPWVAVMAVMIGLATPPLWGQRSGLPPTGNGPLAGPQAGGGLRPEPLPSESSSPPAAPNLGEQLFRPEDTGALVVDVRIQGNRVVSAERLLRVVRTRAGREFQPAMVQDDVRKLFDSKLVRNVRTFVEREPGGVVVVFEVVERPLVEHLRFVGNRGISDRALEKQTGLKAGQPLNVYAVEDGRRKILEHYRSKGFTKTTVSILEGNRPQDRGIVYYVAEGQEELISRVRIVGNNPQLATDARLKTQIKSKAGFLWTWGGRVDRDKIDEDVERLTAYYRGLGYFQAQVGRELEYDESGRWLTLTFVIDEGPRYVVRSLSVEGNSRFSEGPLLDQLKIKQGEFFNLAAMNYDVNTIRDLYGSQGYVFADIKADPRFLEEPGQLDLTYRIAEGKQYRVGQIRIHVDGDYPHTKHSVLLNRVSFSPGDTVDTREIHNSERRLASSQLFENNPAQGIAPKIVYQLPELDESSLAAAADRRAPNVVRGQAPRPAGHELLLNADRRSAFPTLPAAAGQR